jgi:hypothetical protein
MCSAPERVARLGSVILLGNQLSCRGRTNGRVEPKTAASAVKFHGVQFAVLAWGQSGSIA